MKNINKGISLKSNFIWTLLGNVIFYASQWLITITIVKVGSNELAGIYSLGIAIATPLFVLFNMSTRSIQITDMQNEYSFSDYFSLRFYTTILGIFSGILWGFLSVDKLSNLYIIIIICAIKAVDAMADIIYGLMQKNERMDLVSKSMVIRGLTTFGAMFITFFYTKSLTLSLIVMLIVSLIRLILVDIKSIKTFEVFELRFNFKKMINLIKVSFPIALVGIIVALNPNIPRYFLQEYLGEDAVGIYSALVYISVAGNMISSALGQSMTPRLAKLYKEKKKKSFDKIIKIMILIALTMSVCAILLSLVLGKTLLSYLYTAEYIKYYEIFIVIIIWSSINYISSVFGYALTSIRYFKQQTYIQLITLILMILTCYIFISKFGILGAVISGITVASVQLLLGFILLFIARKQMDQNDKDSYMNAEY
ncbi:lipopolysaccharide biosynthesis protein [Priestia megaterium]